MLKPLVCRHRLPEAYNDVMTQIRLLQAYLEVRRVFHRPFDPVDHDAVDLHSVGTEEIG